MNLTRLALKWRALKARSRGGRPEVILIGTGSEGGAVRGRA